MNAVKTKEGNSKSTVRRMLLFSFFVCSFSILIFAVVSAVTLKLPALENHFGYVAPVVTGIAAFLVSLAMSKSSKNRYLEAIGGSALCAFLLFCCSLILGSDENTVYVIIRCLVIIILSVAGAFIGSRSGAKGKKRYKGGTMLKKNLKK